MNQAGMETVPPMASPPMNQAVASVLAPSPTFPESPVDSPASLVASPINSPTSPVASPASPTDSHATSPVASPLASYPASRVASPVASDANSDANSQAIIIRQAEEIENLRAELKKSQEATATSNSHYLKSQAQFYSQKKAHRSLVNSRAELKAKSEEQSIKHVRLGGCYKELEAWSNSQTKASQELVKLNGDLKARSDMGARICNGALEDLADVRSRLTEEESTHRHKNKLLATIEREVEELRARRTKEEKVEPELKAAHAKIAGLSLELKMERKNRKEACLLLETSTEKLEWAERELSTCWSNKEKATLSLKSRYSDLDYAASEIQELRKENRRLERSLIPPIPASTLIWNRRVIRPQPSTSAAAQRLEDTQQPSSLNAPGPAISPPPAAATVDNVPKSEPSSSPAPSTPLPLAAPTTSHVGIQSFIPLRSIVLIQIALSILMLLPVFDALSGPNPPLLRELWQIWQTASEMTRQTARSLQSWNGSASLWKQVLIGVAGWSRDFLGSNDMNSLPNFYGLFQQLFGEQ